MDDPFFSSKSIWYLAVVYSIVSLAAFLLILFRTMTGYSFLDEMMIVFIVPIFIAATRFQTRMYIPTQIGIFLITVTAIYCSESPAFFWRTIYTVTVYSLIVAMSCEITFRNIRHRIQMVNERQELIDMLETALLEINTLTGMLPICSHCHNIRNDKGYWERIDHYITSHTMAEVSHGICPDCMKKYYPEEYKLIEQDHKEREQSGREESEIKNSQTSESHNESDNVPQSKCL